MNKWGRWGGLVAKSFPTLSTPWGLARRAPLSMGFSRQEYWSGFPFPSLGDLPDPGIEPGSPALQADSSPAELQGKPWGRWEENSMKKIRRMAWRQKRENEKLEQLKAQKSWKEWKEFRTEFNLWRKKKLVSCNWLDRKSRHLLMLLMISQWKRPRKAA